ncbi:hypothetical protein HDU67_004590 [Dinochytrium kinnereticum]|nr:hypothetical protein HDU67_004590 [Dinochytrium kinnereticum]
MQRPPPLQEPSETSSSSQDALGQPSIASGVSQTPNEDLRNSLTPMFAVQSQPQPSPFQQEPSANAVASTWMNLFGVHPALLTPPIPTGDLRSAFLVTPVVEGAVGDYFWKSELGSWAPSDKDPYFLQQQTQADVGVTTVAFAPECRRAVSTLADILKDGVDMFKEVESGYVLDCPIPVVPSNTDAGNVNAREGLPFTSNVPHGHALSMDARLPLLNAPFSNNVGETSEPPPLPPPPTTLTWHNVDESGLGQQSNIPTPTTTPSPLIPPFMAWSDSSPPPQAPHPPTASSSSSTYSITTTQTTSSTRKPHACPHCPKTFTREHNLRSHLSVHSPKQPHRCEQCEASFVRRHDLKRHVRAKHSSVRPFRCHVCGTGFSRADSLRKHLEFEERVAASWRGGGFVGGVVEGFVDLVGSGSGGEGGV